MSASIIFKNIWSDEDVVEIDIVANDGLSSFNTRVYVAYTYLEKLAEELDIFKFKIYGGLYDIELGKFGPEYANGAFLARIHLNERGKIYISVKMQTDFFDFGRKNVANEANIHLLSEPALFDNFVNQLKSISQSQGNTAVLECVERR